MEVEKSVRPADLALFKVLQKLELVSHAKLPEGYSPAEKGLIAFFAELGYFEEDVAVEKVAAELDLGTYRIKNPLDQTYVQLFDQEPVGRVEAQRWADMRALPVALSKDRLLVVMSNPLDRDTVAALSFELERGIDVSIGVDSEIMAVIDVKLNYGDAYNLSSILKSSEIPKLKGDNGQPAQSKSSVVQDDPEAAPIIRLVNKIFHEAIRRGASDIHVTPEKSSLIVRARIDGIMTTLFDVPSELSNAVVSRMKLLCGMDIAERRRPQDGRVRLKTSLGSKDLRVSTVPATYGENLVARVLSGELKNLDFKELGMNPELIEQVKGALARSSKVNLVTGPTGSGKTSTLYTALLHLRDGKSNIITLEDPIEYRISGTTQIQVNPKIGLGFNEGLRAALRQDPDTVLLGEIRDSETAATAMRTAQTGHLVLSTLHTNSAPAAITRLRDLEVPSYLIASSIGSVIAQRLVRRLCEECAAPANEIVRARVERLGGATDKLREPVGCDVCGDTGFKGRTGVYSFMDVSPALAEEIRSEAHEDAIEKRARAEGYRTLSEAALDLVLQGVTSIDEAERVVGPLDEQILEGDTAATVNAEEPNGIPKPRILLIEDDEDACDIFRMLLEREMFEVSVARDGRTGLEAIYKNPPELVVSDVMMPNMSGVEMLRRLRADTRMRDLPVLMLTGNVTEEQELKLLSQGADDFVSKTAKTEILLARINRLLPR